MTETSSNGSASDKPDWHAVAEARVRQSFAWVESGDAAALLAIWADECTHRFNGAHALGGARRGKPAVGAWYARLVRLLVGPKFDLTDFWISGTPADMHVVVRWDMWLPADPLERRNHGLHYIRTVSGRCVEQDVACDSALLGAWLAEQVKAGVAEAGAPPITAA